MNALSDSAQQLESSRPAMGINKRLLVLVEIYIFGGFSFALLSAVVARGSFTSTILIAIVMAIAFAQACLLGIWAVFSARSLMSRFLHLFAGLTLAEIMLFFGQQGNSFSLTPTFLAAIIVGVFLPLNLFRYELQFPSITDSEPPRRATFSIMDILMVMSFVAVLSALLRFILAFDAFHWDLAENIVIASASAAICIPVVIAILAAQRIANGIAFLTVALLLPLLIVIASASAVGIRSPIEIFIFPVLAILQITMLTGSLCVIRSCGYRLAAKGTATRRSSMALKWLLLASPFFGTLLGAYFWHKNQGVEGVTFALIGIGLIGASLATLAWRRWALPWSQVAFGVIAFCALVFTLWLRFSHADEVMIIYACGGPSSQTMRQTDTFSLWPRQIFYREVHTRTSSISNVVEEWISGPMSPGGNRHGQWRIRGKNGSNVIWYWEGAHVGQETWRLRNQQLKP